MTLDQVRRYALSLPETQEQPHFELTSFRVRGKIFATAPPDGAHLHLFVGEEQRERALAVDPQVFEKLWWGSRVAGVKAVLARARPALVREFLYLSWCGKAPKRLVASFETRQQRPW